MTVRGTRLLVVGHAYLERTNQRKLEALSRRGLEVGLILPSRWAPLRDALLAERTLRPAASFPGLRLFTASVFRSGHIASYVLAPWAIRRALDDFEPEIVQVEQETYSFAAAQVVWAASRRGCPCVVLGAENLDRPLPLAQRWAERIVLSRTVALISWNRAGIDLARRRGFRGPTCVMPQLGVDPELFRPDLGTRDRPSSPFTLGFVGRLVPEKGVDIVLRAVAVALRDGVQVRLQVTGDGPAKLALQSLAVELGIASCIQWTGTIGHEDVPARMAQLDVLVLPSRDTPQVQEQFGMVLAEAMLLGIPVLGSRSGAIPEVIGREDLLFPQDDHQALADLLRRLSCDAARWQEVRDWVRRRAQQYFTIDVIADGLCRFYDHLRNGSRCEDDLILGYARGRAEAT